VAGAAAMIPLANLIGTVIQLYIYVLIAAAILSWLTAFGIVNRHNAVVNGIGRFCYALTEPVLRPIRRIIPLVGGVDLSPLVLILLLWFIRDELLYYLVFAFR
jgi:YggT family protein